LKIDVAFVVAPLFDTEQSLIVTWFLTMFFWEQFLTMFEYREVELEEGG
jgi:hypothetical protein